MAIKAKLRWWQFSLRTLLIVMAIAGGPLARIAYLRQCAAFHEKEASRHWSKWRSEHPIGNTTRIPEIFTSLGNTDFSESAKHLALAKLYRDAAYRPWRMVDESLLETIPRIN